MSSVIYGLFIALLWGCADIQCSFIPGNSLRVALIAHSIGMLVLVCFSVIFGSLFSLPFPSLLLDRATLAKVAGLGLLGAVTYLCMYRALQSSASTGVISAILAANGAITVFANLLFFHEQDPRLLFLTGMILCGVLLAAVSQSEKCSVHTPGIFWAIGAMIGLGSFNFGIGFMASSGTLHWFPLLFGIRAFSILFLALALAWKPSVKDEEQPRPVSSLLAAGMGLVEMIGLIFFSLAASLHLNMSLIAAIASCSSVVPLLSSVLKHEVIPLYTWRGVALILLGVVGLSWAEISPLLICILVASLFFLQPPLLQLTPSLDLMKRKEMVEPLLSIQTTQSSGFGYFPRRKLPSCNSPEAHSLLLSPAFALFPLRSQFPRGKLALGIAVVVLFFLITGSFLLGQSALPPSPLLVTHHSAGSVSSIHMSFPRNHQQDLCVSQNIEILLLFHPYHLARPVSSCNDVRYEFEGKLTTGASVYLTSSRPNYRIIFANVRRFLMIEKTPTPTLEILTRDTKTGCYQGEDFNLSTSGNVQGSRLFSPLYQQMVQNQAFFYVGFYGWLNRKSRKILTWTNWARGNRSGVRTTDFLHRQVLRATKDLDGDPCAWRAPPPVPCLVDPLTRSVG
jgi:drug/metabolite transporter (DMT)-like permease